MANVVNSIIRAMLFGCAPSCANPPAPDHRAFGQAHFLYYDSGNRPRDLYSIEAAKRASGAGAVAGDCPEIRTTGLVTGPSADGLTLLKNSPNLNIIEVTLQCDSPGSFQLYEGTSPLSGTFILSAFQPWSAPGKKMGADLLLRTSSTGNIRFEVRWKSC